MEKGDLDRWRVFDVRAALPGRLPPRGMHEAMAMLR
jgi:hypothetical protein